MFPVWYVTVTCACQIRVPYQGLMAWVREEGSYQVVLHWARAFCSRGLYAFNFAVDSTLQVMSRLLAWMVVLVDFSCAAGSGR